MVTHKDQPITHKVCSIEYYPMVIFKTLEEAQGYALDYHEIRKVRINVNKKNLNPKRWWR